MIKIQSTRGCEMLINKNDIVFIESFGDKTKIHIRGQQGIIISTTCMKDMCKEIDIISLREKTNLRLINK